MTERSTPIDVALAPGAGLEPATLVPSRKQWWVIVIGAGIFFVISLLAVGFSGDPAALIVTAFAGFWAVLGAIMLAPGANSLRLDENGFEIEHLFRRKKYRWGDVNDFAVRRVGEFNQEVVSFEAGAEANLSLWQRINGALIGKSGCLPNTYGMAAEDLAKLMTAWKNSVKDAAS